jgi:hypothetical protein
MAVLDSKTVNFAVAVASSGTRQIIFSNVHLLDTGPFEAPYQPHWEATMQNMHSEPVDGVIGAWWYHSPREGGWNLFHLEGFEKKTVVATSYIPAEMGTIGLGMNMIVNTPGWKQLNYPDTGGSLVAVCRQRDSDLIPAGQPSVYPNWSGLREFPVPASRYGGVYIKSIALPMLSRSLPTVGKLKVQLLSPQDHNLWESYVCNWNSEQRCGLGIPNGAAPYYIYEVVAGLLNSIGSNALKGADALWGTQLKLTEADSSGLYEFDMTFAPSTFPVGRYPFAMYVEVTIPNSQQGVISEKHPLFWGLQTNNMLMYPTVGYVNVVN